MIGKLRTCDDCGAAMTRVGRPRDAETWTCDCGRRDTLHSVKDVPPYGRVPLWISSRSAGVKA